MIILQRTCVDKLPLQSIVMGELAKDCVITVITFGQLAEEIERTTIISIPQNTKIEQLFTILKIGHWLERGLKVALNGNMTSFDQVISDGDEIALLPPVSGG